MDFLLLEDGFYLLFESSDKLILEWSVASTRIIALYIGGGLSIQIYPYQRCIIFNVN